MSHLQGKTVVITGAASGFGRIVAEMVLDRGANAVGLDIDGEAVEKEFAAFGLEGRALGVGADVTEMAQVRAAVGTAIERFGSVDVMVNNAGIMPLAYFADHEQALDAWDRCIDINIKGVLHGICAVHDHMIRQGHGRIVNISSIYANGGVAGGAVYGASKAAVAVLTDALRVESQGKISVTLVKPTGVPGTGLFDTMINGEAALNLAGQNRDRLVEQATKVVGGDPPPELIDPASVSYWAIKPEELAAQIVHVIDQPLGVTISEITVRATGEDYVF